MKNIMIEVGKKVQEIMDGYEVRCEELKKNNDVTLHGVIITSGKNSLSPVVYIDKMVTDGLSVDEIVEQVIDIYKREQVDQYTDVGKWFSDYENVKDHLALKIINKKSNEQILNDIPYKEFLDLAVIVEIAVSFIKDARGVVKVHHKMIELWKQNFDDVYFQALSNFKKDKTVITSMEDMLRKMGFSDLPGADLVPPMFILTNETSTDGAVRMLDEDVIRDFANELGTDLVVIPSSIHELILLPCSDETDLNGISAMVKDVNITQVDPTEVLSDHGYLYSRECGWII